MKICHSLIEFQIWVNIDHFFSSLTSGSKFHFFMKFSEHFSIKRLTWQTKQDELQDK